MIYPYDQKLQPPAPQVPVKLSHPVSRFGIAVTGFIDSGASVSVIPLALARQFHLPSLGSSAIRGVERTPIEVIRFQVQMEIADISLGLIEDVGAGFPYVLLGRDVLGQFDVILRGRAQTCEITNTVLER